MHDGVVIVFESASVDLSAVVLVKVVPHAGVYITQMDGYVVVTIWATLFVMKSCVKEVNSVFTVDHSFPLCVFLSFSLSFFLPFVLSVSLTLSVTCTSPLHSFPVSHQWRVPIREGRCF